MYFISRPEVLHKRDICIKNDPNRTRNSMGQLSQAILTCYLGRKNHNWHKSQEITIGPIVKSLFQFECNSDMYFETFSLLLASHANFTKPFFYQRFLKSTLKQWKIESQKFKSLPDKFLKVFTPDHRDLSMSHIDFGSFDH